MQYAYFFKSFIMVHCAKNEKNYHYDDKDKKVAKRFFFRKKVPLLEKHFSLDNA